ncbi:MAG: hypothetical protein FJ294_07230, partial [Planctomycetes bacterium]|nr:hypothetical protein [Planctomycetota bacterium]
MLTHALLALLVSFQGPGGPPAGGEAGPAQGGGAKGGEKRAEAPAPGAPIDAKTIQDTVAALEAAFGKDGSTAKKTEAITAAVPVIDARVISAMQKGLTDKESSVVVVTVESLGKMKHPSALDALVGFYKREHKKLAEDLTIMPALLKAIGRHGSPTTIALLKEDAFDQKTYLAGQARILSLGNIRTNAALEALIDLSKMVGPNRMDGLRNDMRVSIAQLTGLDLGPDSIAWTRWWNDNKKGFEVTKEAPKLDAALQRPWEAYWGVGEGAGRGAGRRGGTEPGGEGEGEGEGRGGGTGR